ncbi:MAG TPA: hypothetical protein VJ276_08235 [Thermoanaerobaculia bacterium]|nr:hypothetical protein [Thermoanaerobaculia bacterium]
MSAIELYAQLRRLEPERVAASVEALASDAADIADLDDEISDARSAYVGAAVTEIATLRAELCGPQVG